MKTIGIPISDKKNEMRRCLLPPHISGVKNKDRIFVQEGYGKVLGFDDQDYILGRGNVARGAFKVLAFMGADVTVYDRKTEKLFQKELDKYDVVVNGILWDTKRRDHIIYRSDLKRMKKGSLIIDVSCDRNGGIESSIPINIDQPIYYVDGIAHYVVDHTPSIFISQYHIV